MQEKSQLLVYVLKNESRYFEEIEQANFVQNHNLSLTFSAHHHLI